MLVSAAHRSRMKPNSCSRQDAARNDAYVSFITRGMSSAEYGWRTSMRNLRLMQLGTAAALALAVVAGAATPAFAGVGVGIGIGVPVYAPPPRGYSPPPGYPAPPPRGYWPPAGHA